MTLYIVGGVLLAGFVIFTGYALWTQWRYSEDRPKTWTFTGTAPQFSDVAMGVIWENRPMKTANIRWGGRIQWVDKAIPDISDPKGDGGVVLDINIPELKIVKMEPVWTSALAHELGHYIWKNTYGDIGEDPNDVATKNFKNWVDDTNKKIAEALTPKKAG